MQTVVRIEGSVADGRSGLLGISIPKVWVGLNPGIRFRGPSFAVPQKLRSSPLNLIFRSLTTPSLRLDQRAVAFEGLDFDVF